VMHEREKSDLAVVAVKLANKAERSAAELVERRAGTKGNAGQHSTYRAQYRASLSQVQERIRHVRRQTPEVGAVCGKAARTDLCGGRSAMGVPTAIASLAMTWRGCYRQAGDDNLCRLKPESNLWVSAETIPPRR
jgi:hypothetical protein